MGYHGDSQSKRKSVGEQRPATSSSSFYAGLTPPPSYHSFDGLWSDSERRQRVPSGTEMYHQERQQGMIPQRHTSRNEELTVNRHSRSDRRKHHRPRRSSSSHNSTSWTAKLVFQGLRSNLFGSGNMDQSRQESSGRIPTSRTTKLDLSNTSRDVHYTVHNHWHGTSTSENLSRSKTWPAYEPTRHDVEYFVKSMGESLPTFAFDARSAAHNVAGRPLFPDKTTTFEGFLSGLSPYMSEELEATALWEKFIADWPRHPSHMANHPHSEQGPWWNNCAKAAQRLKEEEKEEEAMTGCYRHWPNNSTNIDPNLSARPHGANRASSTDREGQHPDDYETPSHNTRDYETAMLAAASALTDYNEHWHYIDSVQQPQPRELPWPTIRPAVPFDHMKCDAFSFYAHGCGLQPDRSKAPKLDFKLSPRSPYPSYDQRQQDCERKMLKTFKQQMQREKLRWHEDKLRRKFPEAIGRDDEKRKAVWAAVSEGSAICDRRLGDML
jgi:hypothetical protein